MQISAYLINGSFAYLKLTFEGSMWSMSGAKAIRIRSCLVLLEGCFRLEMLHRISHSYGSAWGLFSWSWRWWGSPAPGLREGAPEGRRRAAGDRNTPDTCDWTPPPSDHSSWCRKHSHSSCRTERERVWAASNKYTSLYIYIYTTSPKFLIWNVFCSPSLHLFDPKYSKSSQIEKYFMIYNNCFLCEYVLNCNLFLYFQRHMIFRNHNNILICWKRKGHVFIGGRQKLLKTI